MKKIISLLLAFSMFASLTTAAYADDEKAFTDIQGTEYYSESAEALSEMNILSGYEDGSFGAEKAITRAEMATIVCKMLGKDAEAEAAKGSSMFDDVAPDHWAIGYILVAFNEGIIAGDGNGKFRPEDSVKYEEAIKMVVCALGLGKDIVIDPLDWSKGFLDVANEKGLVSKLQGQKGVASTRGDVAVLVFNGVSAVKAESSIKPAAPVASLAAGKYSGTKSVTLKTDAENAVIYYTLDGTNPTVESTKYTKAISISKTSTLKAIAVVEGIISDILVVEYTINKSSGGGGGGGGGGGITYYTVSFNLNYDGATGAPQNQSIASTGKATKPVDPTRSNYTFVGWYTDAACTQAFDFANTPIVSAIALYAKWQQNLQAEFELSVNNDSVLADGNNNSLIFYVDTDYDLDSIDLYSGEDKVATLYDNGNFGGNGDDMAGDGIYSAIYYVDENQDATLNFVAKSGQHESNAVIVNVYAPISNEILNQIDEVDNSIEDMISSNDFDNKPIEEKKEAADNLLSELSQSNKIVSNTIQYDENTSIYTFEYADGITGGIMLEDFDDDLNGREAYSPSLFSDDNKIPSSGGSGGAGSSSTVGGAGSSSGGGGGGYAPGGSSGDSESICSALILNAFPAFEYTYDMISFRTEFYEDLYSEWENSGIDTTLDTDVTVEDFKNLDKFDIICIATHGSTVSWYGQTNTTPAICLAEYSTPSKDKKYSIELKTQQIIKVNGMYWILPEFIETQFTEGDLDGSIVFSETCQFMGRFGNVDNEMSDVFINADVDTIIGFHNSVYAVYSRDFMKKYIDSLIEGNTAINAFNVAKAAIGSDHKVWYESNNGPYPSNTPVAYPIFNGDQNAKLVNSEFENGSFELSPMLKGWRRKGDVRVISKLASLVPGHGNNMAILTTGVGAGESEYGEATEGSVLYQSFVVPNDATNLSFIYNVVSEEPHEFIGSSFDDKFKAEIIIDNATIVFTEESVNNSAWLPIGGIDFDGGDSTTYHTGWKIGKIDISQFRNKLITLRFVVYDVGDSQYDTAALIDDVSFVDKTLPEQKSFKYNAQALCDEYYDGYDEFYQSFEKGPIVPGLSDKVVPQGIAYRPDTNEYYITGYISDESDCSVIMAINADTGLYQREFYLYNTDGTPHKGHVGGIAITEDNVFVANGKYLSRISLESIDSIDLCGELEFEEDIMLSIGDADISFCNYADGVLWIGNFWEANKYNKYAYDSYKALALGYILDESTANDFNSDSITYNEDFKYLPDYVCEIPEKIQGITMFDGNMILSKSYGRENDSTIYIGEDPTYECESEDDIILDDVITPVLKFEASDEIVAIPMIEGISSCEYGVVSVFESGAKKYREDGGVNPTDSLWIMYY